MGQVVQFDASSLICSVVSACLGLNVDGMFYVRQEFAKDRLPGGCPMFGQSLILSGSAGQM